jgi:hypothetical protein
MDKRDKSTPIEQDDVLIGKIKLLAGKTETDPNPEELESLKKLIKKNVPWRLRGYFMAYLLREITKSNKNDKAPRQRSPKSRNTKAKKPFAESTVAPKAAKTETKEVKKPKVQKPLPDGAKTLYLNVGKMKKLYTKELSLLLQDKLSITRDDIYSIRVHDKYSFITMDEKNCEKAIELLDGTDIKGRTASITYSKKK